MILRRRPSFFSRGPFRPRTVVRIEPFNRMILRLERAERAITRIKGGILR